MTERTYKKDLEVIDLVRCFFFSEIIMSIILMFLFQWFRDELRKEECSMNEEVSLLFNHVDPIYEHHTILLKEMEHRFASWLEF